MLERLSAEKLRDLLLPMSARGRRGVYFVRLCNWDEGVRADVWACHEAARKRGVLLEGQMHNPDDRQLSYMRDVLGTGFAPDADFLAGALEKWMPRMSAANRQALAREMARNTTIQLRLINPPSTCMV